VYLHGRSWAEARDTVRAGGIEKRACAWDNRSGEQRWCLGDTNDGVGQAQRSAESRLDYTFDMEDSECVC
jgi:hypothetical protein